MLLLDDPLLLYRQRNHHSLTEYLRRHIKQTQVLQFHDGDTITSTCRHLSRELKRYAKAKSGVYNSITKTISKQHLSDKNNWYVDGFHAHAAITGGSTTGVPFHYLRWAEHYDAIEGDNHYRAILQEFKLDRPIQLLYLMLDLTDDRHSDELVKVYKTRNILISHGQGQIATVHEIVCNRLYYTDYYGFYEAIFNYCDQHAIDVVLAPGQAIASLAWNARRLRRSAPICKLLSNTGNKVSRVDLDFLKDNGLVGQWCDHMRCWDGGITFFTCRYHTYHLIDGLAWVKSDSNGRLISDDYYSLPSPFVNYWNGDYGKVGETFQRCRCGRSYREFEINRTRSVVMAGVHNHAIRDQIINTDLDIAAIKRSEWIGSFLRLFTTRPLSTRERQSIRTALPNLEVNFVTEEPNG